MRSVILCLIANAVFPLFAAILLLIKEWVTHLTPKGLMDVVTGVILALIGFGSILLFLSLPAMLCSLVMVVAGSFIHPTIAMAIAALSGAAIIFKRMSGDVAHAMRSRMSVRDSIMLAIVYALCWPVTAWYFEESDLRLM